MRPVLQRLLDPSGNSLRVPQRNVIFQSGRPRFVASFDSSKTTHPTWSRPHVWRESAPQLNELRPTWNRRCFGNGARQAHINAARLRFTDGALPASTTLPLNLRGTLGNSCVSQRRTQRSISCRRECNNRCALHVQAFSLYVGCPCPRACPVCHAPSRTSRTPVRTMSHDAADVAIGCVWLKPEEHVAMRCACTENFGWLCRDSSGSALWRMTRASSRWSRLCSTVPSADDTSGAFPQPQHLLSDNAIPRNERYDGLPRPQPFPSQV